MEIKTTKQIMNEGSRFNIMTDDVFFNPTEKWVSVDELIEELEDLNEMRRLELIKQLKGEQK